MALPWILMKESLNSPISLIPIPEKRSCVIFISLIIFLFYIVLGVPTQCVGKSGNNNHSQLQTQVMKNISLFPSQIIMFGICYNEESLM